MAGPPTSKAYSYVRWSSDKQTAGDSLRRQTEAARKWAAAHGLELDESTDYTDAAVSAFQGANEETGRLGEFKKAVDDGLVPRGSYLLVESLDRISRRKARHAVRALEAICDAGITVVTLADGRTYSTETLDDDPMAFMYAIMVAMRAHEESATKSKRVREARARNRAQAAQGQKTTAKTPAWLTLSEDRKRFIIDEARAAVIRRIYEAYADGQGTTVIARRLNQDGVPPFGSSHGWSKQYVGKLLHSKAPSGTLEQFEHREPGTKGPLKTKVSEVPGYYPAIVDPELAARVALKAGGNQPRGRHANALTRNLFAGVGRCPSCGGAIVRVSNSTRNRNDRLICGRAKTGACSNGKTVSLHFVVDAFKDQIERMLDPGEQSGNDAVDAVQAAEAAVDAAIDRVREVALQIAREPSSSAVLKEARLAAERELARAQEARDTAIQEADVVAGPAWRIERDRLLHALAADDVPAANTALRRLAQSVTMFIAEGQFEVQWRTGAEATGWWRLPFDDESKKQQSA